MRWGACGERLAGPSGNSAGAQLVAILRLIACEHTIRCPLGKSASSHPTLCPCRITSLARSASARRRSLLRLVQQPDEAEGRRSHSLPPEARPLLRAPTQALPDGSTAARPRGRRRYDSSEQPLPAPDAASSPHANGACGDMPAPTLAAAATAGGSSGPDAVTAPSTQPPPLPVLPGGVAGGAGSAAAEAAAGEEAEGQQLQQRKEQVVGSERAAAEQLCRDEAVFCGLSAAEEAAALPSGAPPPAWLRQQGCTNVTVGWGVGASMLCHSHAPSCLLAGFPCVHFPACFRCPLPHLLSHSRAPCPLPPPLLTGRACGAVPRPVGASPGGCGSVARAVDQRAAGARLQGRAGQVGVVGADACGCCVKCAQRLA